MDNNDTSTDTGVLKQQQDRRGHEIVTKLLRTPPYAYACLEIISDRNGAPETDLITVRSHLTSALNQFLGLTGSAISIDILKLERSVCWIRMPREDLSPVLAALGGWVTSSETGGSIGWKVKGSSNWLGALVAREDADKLWT